MHNFFSFPGHLIFEMAAGYELTQLRPGAGEYQTVSKAVRPILKFIFEEGLPHNTSNVCYAPYIAASHGYNLIFIIQILAQDFFDVPLPEIQNFDPALVSLSDSTMLMGGESGFQGEG